MTAAVGDRVTVLCPQGRYGLITPRRGQILSENADRNSYTVRMDEYRVPKGVHKSFVVTESIEAFRARFASCAQIASSP